MLVLGYEIVGGGNEIVLVVGFRGGDSRAPKGINGSSLRRRLSFAQRLSSKKSLGKSVQFLETSAGGHRLVFVKRRREGTGRHDWWARGGVFNSAVAAVWGLMLERYCR